MSDMHSGAARAQTYDLDQVAVLHAGVPGRVRLRCPSLYRGSRRLALLERRLLKHGHIVSVRGNVRTASLLVHFTAEETAERVGRVVLVELARLDGRGAEAEPINGQRPHPPDRSRRHEQDARRDRFGSASSEDLRTGEYLPAERHSSPTRLRSSGPDWYRQSGEEVCRALATHATEGLTDTAAMQRLADGGPNALPRPHRRSDYELFVSQLCNGPVAMLGAAAALSIATGGLLDAAAIGAVVLINAAIGFATERQSERIIESLHRPDAGTARVTRGREPRELAITDLVPGDLVHIGAGEQVPADIRLLKADRLTVNESLLTGESAAVSKNTDRIDGERALGDRRNMVFRDSQVLSGSGSGIVVATGVATEVGRVHDLIGESRPPDTPMQVQLDRIGTQLVWMSAGICVGIFAMGWLRGYGLLSMLSRAVSLAVAALPEGLPTVATTTLALGVREMRDHRALVRSLNAVETLGACSVVCLDKTGTLTENRLRAVQVQTLDHTFDLEEEPRLDVACPETFEHLGRSLALCVENGHHRPASDTGNGFSPTETALVELAGRAVGDPEEFRHRHRLIDIQDRDDRRPYLITRHQMDDGTVVSAKGSPESLLDLCAWVLADRGRIALDDGMRECILEQNQRMADQSLRVLAVAYALPANDGEPGDNRLTWIGLVGLADPVRAGARELIDQLHRAGIQTVMLTGDQAPTARAIARNLNLSNGDPLRVVDARELQDLRDLDSVHAFSRVAPSQKSDIVTAFQRSGKVVAMTGDGVNDGPALKAADIGIALGANGTETARLAADIVLEDDNLETLVFSVRQGRTIYGNIRKSIHYLLATNLSEIEVMLASVVCNLGQPLSPMQLLWINLVTDIFPGLALAMEPPEPDALERPPRDPRIPIIDDGDFRRLALESSAISAGALGSYLYGLARYGAGAPAGGLCFVTLVLAQLLHTWSCRSDAPVLGGQQHRNRYIEMAVGGSLGLQALAALVPPMRRLLAIPRLGPIDALVIVAGALAPLAINEVTKRMLPPRQKAEQPPAKRQS